MCKLANHNYTYKNLITLKASFFFNLHVDMGSLPYAENQFFFLKHCLISVSCTDMSVM